MISRRTVTPVGRLMRLLRKTIVCRPNPHRDDYRFQVTLAFAEDLSKELSQTSYPLIPSQRILESMRDGRILVAGVRVKVLACPWPYAAEIVLHSRGPAGAIHVRRAVGRMETVGSS